MPIDINLLREGRGGDPEAVRESQRRRFSSVELVDQCMAKDTEWREAQGTVDNLRRDRNQVQQEVGKKKKAKEECDDLVAQIQDFDKRITEAEAVVKVVKEELDKMVAKIGNIVDPSVPVSQDEEKDTEVVRTWGPTPTGDHLLHHHDLLWRVGGYEPERGVSVAGHRAYFLRDAGVLLNQALINYGIAFLRKRQYSILQPPYFMNKDVMGGVAQLEQFDEELYKVTGEDDKYLIATSEQPICGFHRNDWLQPNQLPIRYGGVSTCFRKEAGSHGKDTWGIFRVHQFDKVEQFVICDGDLEVSQKMQDEMIAAAEEFYQSLGISYRVVNIVSGELNNAAIKKYDLEGWFPGYESYRELVSCSNCTDYQARSMEIRWGNKVAGQDKKYVHMLNATLCACTRTICAILENYQTPEGVRVPEVLVPFLGGITFFPFVREPRKDGASAKAQDKKKKAGEAAKPAATQAPLPPPPPSPPSQASKVAPPPAPGGASPSEADTLGAAITAKGNEIRDLKAAKADKDAIKVQVDELLVLKNMYKDLTGKDFQAGGAAPPAPAPKKAPAPPKAAVASTGTSTKAATAAAGGGGGGGGPGDATAQLIVAKGEEIRQLKAAKADKAALEPHIKDLLDLKAKYKTETGADYGAPPAAPKADKAKAPAKAAKPSAPPAKPTAAAPAPSPAPAPTPTTTTSSKPKHPADPSGPLVHNGKPDLPGLDAYLLRRTFMRGFVPSQDDVVLLSLVRDVKLDDYPSVKRWAKHIASYTPAETAAWTA